MHGTKLSLTQSLHKAALERPTATADIFQGRRKTFAQLRDRVARLAAGLHPMGVSPNDRVAILALNSDRYMEYIYACFWSGAVINPVNTRWSSSEIAYLLNDCASHVLFVDDNVEHLVEPLQALFPDLSTLIQCGESSALSGRH